MLIRYFVTASNAIKPTHASSLKVSCIDFSEDLIEERFYFPEAFCKCMDFINPFILKSSRKQSRTERYTQKGQRRTGKINDSLVWLILEIHVFYN